MAVTADAFYSTDIIFMSVTAEVFCSTDIIFYVSNCWHVL
jgi:hypothetical protein